MNRSAPTNQAGLTMFGALFFGGQIDWRKKANASAKAVISLALAKHSHAFVSGRKHVFGTSVTITPEEAGCTSEDLEFGARKIAAAQFPYELKNGGRGFISAVRHYRMTSNGKLVILLNKELIGPPSFVMKEAA